MTGRILYLLGGAPRVGTSTLAQRLLATDGIPWLPSDVIRTVLRRVLPELDAVDQDPVDATRLAELMYPHIEQAAGVCVEEAEQFLIEGFELAPTYPARLKAALPGTVTLTKPSMSGLVGACWPRTRRIATARTPFNPGW